MDKSWQPATVLVGYHDLAQEEWNNLHLNTFGVISHLGATPKHDGVLSPLEVSEIGLNLIKNGWLQGALAVDHNGQHCDPWSDMASKWCVLGSWQAVLYYQPIDAKEREYQERYLNSVWNLVNLNYMMDLQGAIPALNDTSSTPHERIIKCYTKLVNHFIAHPEANKWAYKPNAPEPKAPKYFNAY